MAKTRKPRKRYKPLTQSYSFTLQIVLAELSEIKEALKEERLFAKQYYILVNAFQHLIASFDFIIDKNNKVVRYINSLINTIDNICKKILSKSDFVEDKIKSVPTSVLLPKVGRLKLLWFITELEKTYTVLDMQLLMGMNTKEYLQKIKNAELNFSIHEKLRDSPCLTFKKFILETFNENRTQT